MRNLNNKIKRKQVDPSTGRLIHSGSKPSTTIKHHFHLRSSQVYVDSTDQQQISYKPTPNSNQPTIIGKSNQQHHNKTNETKVVTSIEKYEVFNDVNETEPSLEQRGIGEYEK